LNSPANKPYQRIGYIEDRIFHVTDVHCDDNGLTCRFNGGEAA
jgi:hypothetical protein